MFSSDRGSSCWRPPSPTWSGTAPDCTSCKPTWTPQTGIAQEDKANSSSVTLLRGRSGIFLYYTRSSYFQIAFQYRSDTIPLCKRSIVRDPADFHMSLPRIVCKHYCRLLRKMSSTFVHYTKCTRHLLSYCTRFGTCLLRIECIGLRQPRFQTFRAHRTCIH